MLDCLILTHNEALNLPHALASLAGLASRIFVVDSGSTDGTQALAKQQGAIVLEHVWEGYAAQRNWALDNAELESDWVLILDADESLSHELASEITAIVNQTAETVRESAFYLNRVLIFMGGEIRHSGYFPSWNLRLFKRGTARYEARGVHEHLLVAGEKGYLRNLIRHEDRRGLEHYIAKHNRYSTLEAQELFGQREPWPGFVRFARDRTARRRFIKYRVAPKVGIPWLWRFLYMYIARLGFLDRQAGLGFCLFISSYEMFIRLKYHELERTGGRGLPQVAGLAIPEGGSVRQIASGAVTQLARVAPPAPREYANRLPVRQVRSVNRTSRSGEMMREPSQWTTGQKVVRVAWSFAQGTLFRFSPHNAYGFRRLLLRVFGAKIGRDVRIRATANIEIPWNLSIGDHSVVGDHAILYCLGKVTVGQYVTISQYAHLCAGTHETTSRRMALLKPPITIGDDVWIAADAFVGPGVTIGSRTILGARASAFKDLPEGVVAVGNPAVAVKQREFEPN